MVKHKMGFSWGRGATCRERRVIVEVSVAVVAVVELVSSGSSSCGEQQEVLVVCSGRSGSVTTRACSTNGTAK